VYRLTLAKAFLRIFFKVNEEQKSILLGKVKTKFSQHLMNWTTVYIKGKPGFHKEVLHHLEQSGFSFMPGSEDNGLTLFWIDESSSVRDFKKAIGAKTVFKYRLQFFTSIEEFENTKTRKKISVFSSEEQAMVKKMNVWEKAHPQHFNKTFVTL
jgi:hypothetical protein